MKEWTKPKLQVLDLNELVKTISANAKSGGGGGGGNCTEWYVKNGFMMEI